MTTEVDAEAVDRAASRAEVVGEAKTFFREFAVATWAALVGVGIGVYGCWVFSTTRLGIVSSPWYLVSTWTVFALGFATPFVLWTAIKLIAFVARRP